MKEFKRVLKFTFFSISAGLIEMGAFALLNETLSFPYWLSYLLALVLSILWNFTLNRKFTFQSASNIPPVWSTGIPLRSAGTSISPRRQIWRSTLSRNSSIYVSLCLAIP